MATAIIDKPAISEAEWEARQQLAACYRVFDMLGWSEMIYNHITLKVPASVPPFQAPAMSFSRNSSPL